MSTPSGSIGLTAGASSAGSKGSPKATSRYSATDSHPVGSASPKLSCGPGGEPRRVGHRHPGPAQRPLPHAGHVPVARPAHLAELGETGPDPHRTGASGRAAPAPARLRPSRGNARGRSPPTPGPGPCPGFLPRAGPRRPPCARPRARCRLRSRSTASSGSPRGRVRPGPLGSPATGSRGAARPRHGPRAGHVVLVAMAVHGLGEVEPGLFERVVPQGEVEVLGPFLERAAGTPHVLDDRTHATVAPAHEALHRGGLGVVPAQGQAPRRPRRVLQQAHLAAQLGHGVLAEPLERRVGLGHEAAHRGGDGHVVVVAATDLGAGTGQTGDAEHVLVGLGGQADEEVQLHPPPALGEGGVDGGIEVLFPDELVDDLAHAPRPALGGEGEAGAAHLLDLGGQAHGEGVDAQAGQAHRHLARALRVVDDRGTRLHRCRRSRRWTETSG